MSVAIFGEFNVSDHLFSQQVTSGVVQEGVVVVAEICLIFSAKFL